MKSTAWYIFGMSIAHSVICALSWSWALGLHFDWWKLPIIGALSSILNLIIIVVTKAISKAQQ